MESSLFAAVPLEGSFEGMDGCGVGIDIEPAPGGFLVSGIAEGGPVSASDLTVGDTIVSVGGKTVARLPKAEVESLLSGPFGSSGTRSPPWQRHRLAVSTEQSNGTSWEVQVQNTGDTSQRDQTLALVKAHMIDECWCGRHR